MLEVDVKDATPSESINHVRQRVELVVYLRPVNIAEESLPEVEAKEGV